MSNLLVCAVFDSAAGCYGRPFFTPAKGIAIRGFVDEVRRSSPENPFNAHPEDFTLFCLAEFDDNSGTFNNLTVPDKLMTGLSVMSLSE